MNEINLNFRNYNRVILDIGTGDGRFVYKHAKENPDTLCIGIEPAKSQIKEFQRKINREKLVNAFLLVTPVELIPQELENQVDEIYINFPWGSLLKYVVSCDRNFIYNLKVLLKKHGEVIITFGYTAEAEPSKTEQYELPKIDQNYLINNLVPKYETQGFSNSSVSILNKEDMRKINSSWGKKLSFGQDRPIFQIIFSKKN